MPVAQRGIFLGGKGRKFTDFKRNKIQKKLKTKSKILLLY